MMVLLPSRAPFVPTRTEVMHEIVSLIGTLPKGSVFYDLGCGDARMLIEIAKQNPQAKFVGIEFQFIPYFIARYRTRGTSIQIRHGMFETHSLADATHVYTYLYPQVMDALLAKVEKELKPGASVYSLDFVFSKRKEDREVALSTGDPKKLGRKLYVYTF